MRGEITAVCQECGKAFPHKGKGPVPKFCSEKCFREKERRRYNAYYARKKGVEVEPPVKQITHYPTKFDLRLEELRKQGKTYAQAQMERTLAALPRIGAGQ